MMRAPEVVLLVVCLLIVGACSGGATDPSGPPAQPSAPAAAPSGAEPEGDDVPALVGTWDYEYDHAERRTILKNFAGLVDHADRVVARLAFSDDGDWWLGFLFDGKLFLLAGVPEGDGGTYTVDGDRLATTGAHGEALVTYDWRLKGRELALTAIEECELAAGEKVGCTRARKDMDPMMLLVTQHSFTRSGSDVTY